MNWSSFSDFIDMGGYGLYVWGSYLMALGALLWEVALLVQRERSARADASQHAMTYADLHEPAA